MKKFVIAIAVMLFVGIVLYLMGYVFPYAFVSREGLVNNSNCNDERIARSEDIQGTVTRKFRDKESHMWRTLEYSNDKGPHLTLIFRNDESGAYDFISPGDSIVKNSDSINLQILRNGAEKKYKLDYGCK